MEENNQYTGNATLYITNQNDQESKLLATTTLTKNMQVKETPILTFKKIFQVRILYLLNIVKSFYSVFNHIIWLLQRL